MEQFKKILIGAGVLAVLLIVFFISLTLRTKVDQNKVSELQNKNSQQTEIQPQTPEQKAQSEQYNNYAPANSGQFSYQYVPGRKDGDPINPQNSDGKIFKVNNVTGSRVEIIPSIKALLPSKDRNDYSFLNQIAVSPTKPSLYFTLDYIEGSGGLFRFDGNTQKLTELKISSYFGGEGGTSLSDSGLFGVSIQDPQNQENDHTIFLLDLEKDSVKTLAVIPKDQTPNLCGLEGCLGSIGANINWLNERDFEIDIFNATPGKDADGNPKAILIEKRKFTIK